MVKQIEEHYCDRCGDLIEKQHPGVEIPGTKPNMGITMLTNTWHYQELCDRCSKSFIIWWDAPNDKNHKEAADGQ